MAYGRPAVAIAAAALAVVLLCLGTLPASGFISAAAAGSRPTTQERSPAGLLRGGRAAVRADAAASPPAATESWIARLAVMAAVIVGICAGAASPSQAFFGLGKSGEFIGEFQTSGMIFKDTLDVERIVDPKVKGVTIYQTDFSKTALDKMMAGNLIQSDSGASGLACIADGPVLIAKDLSKDKSGEEIFSENKGIGKSLKIRRVYDERSKNLVYVVFTERFQKSEDPNGSRFKSVACAVHVTGEQ